MLVASRALVAGLLSAALVAELPGSAALATSGTHRTSRMHIAATVSTAVPPARILVKEPIRPQLMRERGFIRPKEAQAIRRASGLRVTAPPMLRPADFDRVVSAARRRAMTAGITQRVVTTPRTTIVPPKGGVTPPGTRKTLALPSDPTASGTGINPWWRYQEQNVPGGGHLMVNVGTGNLVLQDDEMSIPHKGIALAFRRTYNSQSGHDVNATDATGLVVEPPGMYGNGWTNTFDAHLARNADSSVYTVFDIDGARYDYDATWPANAPEGVYMPRVGNHASLAYDGNCGYLWTKKSGTTYYFYRPGPHAPCPMLSGTTEGYAGRLYQIVGRNHNTFITFTYTWDNGDASLTGKISNIYATTESGLRASLFFADFNGHRLLQMLVYPDNTTPVYYGYDSSGNLTGVSKPENGTAGVRPLQWYGYQSIGTGSILNYQASPRWTAGCATVCGSDGNVLYFGFSGSAAATSLLNSIQHRGVVNPNIRDGTGTTGLQPGYPTSDLYYLTEYYATGVTTPAYRDTDGHMTNWVVDGIGRPTQMQACTLTTGQGTQCTGTWLLTNETWDASNNLTAETDARGNQMDYAHDINGNTVADAQPAVTVSVPGGFATFRPTQFYDYDANNNVTAYCDAQSTHASGSDWVGTGPAVSDSLCSSTASNGAHATFTFSTPSYEPFGELTTITSALGYSRHLAYNSNLQGGMDFGLPTDVSGDVIAQSDGTSRQPYTRYSYDQQGNVVCVAANANDQTTVHALSYNALNRVNAVADPDDASMAGCSRTPGLPGSTIVARTTYFQDGSKASNQSPPEAAKSVATQYTYDLDGNEATQVRHFGDVSATTKKWYDGLDRLVEISQPMDPSDPISYPWLTRYLYDLSEQGTAGLPPSINGNSVMAYGNLFKTVEYMPPTTAGMPTDLSGTPLWSDIRGTAFDGLGRVTASYEAAFGSTPKLRNFYDGTGQNGLLTQTVNGAQQADTLTYDTLGRVLSQTFSGDSGLTPNRSFVYDISRNLHSITTSDLGTETYAYDVEGRETSKVEATGGGVGTPGTISHAYYGDGTLRTVSIASSMFALPITISSTYRGDGRLATETEIDGSAAHTFSWSYTGAGRVSQRVDPLNGTMAPANVNGYYPAVTFVPQSYRYDSSGQLAGMTIPRNAAYSAITHDAEGETTSFDAYQATPNVPAWHQAMSYTVRGELQSEAVTSGSKGNSLQHKYAFGFDLGQAADFSYQQADLRSSQVVRKASGQILNVTYHYDGAGRMLASSSSAQQPGPNFSTINVAGSFARAYDAQDNFRSEALSGTYINQSSGQTVIAPITEAALTISYWPDGRAAKVVSQGGTDTDSSGGTETLHWDGDRILYISTDVGNGGGGALVFVGATAVFQYQYQNPAAIVAEVYDRDWSGNAVTSHRTNGYGAWGEFNVRSPRLGNRQPGPYYPVQSSDSDVPYDTVAFPFARRTDGYAVDQILFQGVRTYDSAANQWTTPDAYAGDVHDPMSQKPFMWNRNNPFDYSDPSGFKIKWGGDVYDQHMAAALYDEAIDYFSKKNAYEAANLLRTLRDDPSFTIMGIVTQAEVGKIITEREDQVGIGNGVVTLNWDANLGLVPSTGSRARAQSPALGLLHEASHALRAVRDPAGLAKDRATYDPNYQNAEEKRVIQGIESGNALFLGEALRFDHAGQSCVTAPVTGTVCK